MDLAKKSSFARTGLFENLKSKFGADSVLNTGSHGEYRQLIGDFIRDGGLEDSSPDILQDPIQRVLSFTKTDLLPLSQDIS